MIGPSVVAVPISSAPVRASHSRTAPSGEAVARRDPSGAGAQARTPPGGRIVRSSPSPSRGGVRVRNHSGPVSRRDLSASTSRPAGPSDHWSRLCSCCQRIAGRSWRTCASRPTAAAAKRVQGERPRMISMPGRRKGMLLRARKLNCRWQRIEKGLCIRVLWFLNNFVP